MSGMKAHRVAIALLLVLVLVLALSACGQSAPAGDANGNGTGGGSAADTDTDTGEPTYKVHFAVYWTGHPWIAALVEHLKYQMESYPNVELTISDAQNKKEKLISDMEDAISRGVDMIIVNSSDADSPRDVAIRAEAEGVRVVGLQKLINGEDYTAAIVADEADIGRLQIDSVAKALEEKYGKVEGKLAILNGIPGSSNTVERNEGWEEQLAKYSGIEVIADQPAYFRRDDGRSITENWIQGKLDIDAIVAAVDESAIGAALAYRDVGREGDVIIVGGNAQMEALELVKGGELYSSAWIPDTVDEGMEVLLKILEGEEVPFLTKVKGVMIDRDNVDDVYTQACYVYRGPAHEEHLMPDGC